VKHDPDSIIAALGERYPELSPQLRQAAQYVLDHAGEVGLNSMRAVAAAAGVKPNTLVRLARALDFAGYQEFRQPFREALRGGVESFPDRARWLQSIARGNRHGQLLSQMAAASLANIEQLFSTIDAAEVKAAADRMDRARTTYVLGVGTCHALAHNFCYVAGMALDNLVAVPGNGGLAVDAITRIGRRDVLFAMTFEPYRREVVEAVRLARRRGATVIAATDSRASPISREARHLFVVPTRTPQFFLSVVAIGALLESLLSFMIAAADRRVVGRIDDFHRARAEAGVVLVRG